MAKVESFSEIYRLTPVTERLLSSVLTGSETAVRLNHAMIERVIETGKLVSMQFLAAATVNDLVLRLYFRARDGLFIKDIPLTSDDFNRDLFLDLLAYNTRHNSELFPDATDFSVH